MSKISSGNIKDDVKGITSELKKYVQSKVGLAILTMGEGLSESVGDSAGKIIAVPFLVIAFIFLLVALALFVANILNSMVLGFVVGSGPCLIAGLLIYILAPPNITRKMQDKIAEKVVDELDTNSKDDALDKNKGLNQSTSVNKAED